jgi:hypothetical protein
LCCLSGQSGRKLQAPLLNIFKDGGARSGEEDLQINREREREREQKKVVSEEDNKKNLNLHFI